MTEIGMGIAVSANWIVIVAISLYPIYGKCKEKDVPTQITITMLLCKELILIRGQPPIQGGSPRATLERGEFT